MTFRVAEFDTVDDLAIAHRKSAAVGDEATTTGKFYAERAT
jgi:hypothetical protein